MAVPAADRASRVSASRFKRPANLGGVIRCYKRHGADHATKIRGDLQETEKQNEDQRDQNLEIWRDVAQLHAREDISSSFWM